MTTRRKFIQQATLATGGLLLSTSVLANAFSPRKKKVIIIGAGLAGLMAGYELHKRRIDFVIIESRKRVGGRVFSHTMGTENFIVELGAEWVGADHHMLIRLCEDLGLPLKNNQFKTQAIYNGTYHPNLEEMLNPQWEAKFKHMLQVYRNMDPAKKLALDHKLDKTDWWRYLIDNGCPDTDLDIRDLLDSTDFGESIREVSALAAMGEYANNVISTHNQMDLKVEGGNSRIAEALRSLFADKVITGKHVARVMQRDKVKVYCEDGYLVEGDKLICTAPTFAVSRINWEPALPPPMVSALQGLEYARINKNAVLFKNRFWQHDDFDMITDMPGHYFYHATKNQTAGKDTGVLISYTVGDKAAVIANQQDDDRLRIINQSLKAAFKHTKAQAREQVNYYWGNDRYSKGAYAVYGKGQWYDLFPKLNAPHIHTHFAGEHLSENWGGFMEGALETGKAAADKI